MDVKNLLDGIEIIESKGEIPQSIHALAYHSAKVSPGDLFVCIRGYVTDGHQYLKNAMEAGAVLAIVEEFCDVAIPQIRVGNSRLTLALMAATYFNHPSSRMHTVGITATNGKTSTSFMVDAIFEAAKKQTGIIGTVMTKFADTLIPSILTTPESLDLHTYFSQMLECDISHVTMEVSSSGLELDRIGGVDFDVVALNNISHEHIDQHGSFEAYLHHKTKLIKRAKATSWAVLNLDDSYSAALVSETPAKVLTYGVKAKDGDLVVDELDISTGRATMKVRLKRALETKFGQVAPQTFEIRLGVAGYHSVMNALAAIGIALVSGIDSKSIQQGLWDYKGVERRFEFIHEGDFIIVDDHFANAGNIQVTLETMDYMHYENLVLVYAIRGSRGVTVNRENAEMIVNWAGKLGLKEIIATRSVSHVDKKDVVLQEELDVFNHIMKEHSIKVTLFDELPDAIALGLERVKPGDVLMLAGCQGMDFGGHIALKQLSKRRPDLDQEQLFAPLKDRVCGIEKD